MADRVMRRCFYNVSRRQRVVQCPKDAILPIENAILCKRHFKQQTDRIRASKGANWHTVR